MLKRRRGNDATLARNIEMFRAYLRGKAIEQIATKHGLSVSQVRRIAAQMRWDQYEGREQKSKMDAVYQEETKAEEYFATLIREYRNGSLRRSRRWGGWESSYSAVAHPDTFRMCDMFENPNIIDECVYPPESPDRITVKFWQERKLSEEEESFLTDFIETGKIDEETINLSDEAPSYP